MLRSDGAALSGDRRVSQKQKESVDLRAAEAAAVAARAVGRTDGRTDRTERLKTKYNYYPKASRLFYFSTEIDLNTKT